MKLKEDAFLELYKNKTHECINLLPHYIRTFTIYIIITGALIKFALDSNSTVELRKSIEIFGIIISFVGIVVCILGNRLNKNIEKDLTNISRILEVPVTVSSFKPLKYMVIISWIFNIIIMFGWLFLAILGSKFGIKL